MDDPYSSLLGAVSQVGFPIVLTGYLLVRFEKKLELLTETIIRLSEVINNQSSEETHEKK